MCPLRLDRGLTSVFCDFRELACLFVCVQLMHTLLSLSLIAMIDASCYTTVDLHHTLAKQIAQAGAAYVTGRDSFDSYCTESLHLCPGSGGNKVVGWAQDKLGPETQQRALKPAPSKGHK